MADLNTARHGKKQVVLLMDDALFDLASSVAALEEQSMSGLMRRALQVYCLKSTDGWRAELEKFDTMSKARMSDDARAASVPADVARAVLARSTSRRLVGPATARRPPRKR